MEDILDVLFQADLASNIEKMRLLLLITSFVPNSKYKRFLSFYRIMCLVVTLIMI